MKIEKQKLAEVIRDRRIAEGYTQTELAEKTGISLRSIQRIEKAEVLPRSFTIKALATVLDFSDQDLQAEDQPSSDPIKAKKIILSAGSPPVLFLLAYAFVAQSSTFPETDFESALFWAGLIVMLGFLQWMIWTKLNK